MIWSEHRLLDSDFERPLLTSPPCCRNSAEPVAQRRLGDRGWHGHRPFPAQFTRVVKACGPFARRPGVEHAQNHGQASGSRFADRRRIVSPRQDLLQMYETGIGQLQGARHLRDRGRTDRDPRRAALPGIRTRCRNRSCRPDGSITSCRWSRNLRDESDPENPTRLVSCPNRKGQKKKIYNIDRRVDGALFPTTDLSSELIRVISTSSPCNGGRGDGPGTVAGVAGFPQIHGYAGD